MSYNCGSALSALNARLLCILHFCMFMYLYIGPPSTSSITFTEICTSDAAVSWDPFTSNSVCGPVSYDVTISPSDGVVLMRITNTSYNFTGLMPDTNYTVTVAGRNFAGEESLSETERTPTKQDALPNGNLLLLCTALYCTVPCRATVPW